MTSRCTKSFQALHIDQIGKVWEATFNMAPNQQHTHGNDPFAKVKFMIPPFYGLYDAEAFRLGDDY
jgi:hypothetical protein